MEKKTVLIGICIPGIIIVSIFSIVMIFNKPDLEIQKKNNNLIVELSNETPVNINIKDINKIEYLKGYLLMDKNYISKDGQQVETFDLYNGNQNVEVIAMNNNGSGIYIETAKNKYLIATDNSNETEKLYKKLKSGRNINVKYIGNM